MTSPTPAVAQPVIDGLLDVFERPYTDIDDPRLKCAQNLTKAEAEAVLEYRGNLISILAERPSVAQTSGSVVVPREPTGDMIGAGEDAHTEVMGAASPYAITQAYRAMIAAAPLEGVEKPQGSSGKPDTHRTDGEVSRWRSPTESPDIGVGDEAWFIVAVKRGHSGRIHSFGAAYLNGVEMFDEDDNSAMTMKGWYDTSNDDDRTLYNPVIGNKDELMGWREFPVFAPPHQAGDVSSQTEGE